jgi:hypothetical protein
MMQKMFLLWVDLLTVGHVFTWLSVDIYISDSLALWKMFDSLLLALMESFVWFWFFYYSFYFVVLQLPKFLFYFFGGVGAGREREVGR